MPEYQLPPDASQMLALAVASGSPALQALVIGHLQAGRPDAARVALCMPPMMLSVLDAWLASEIDKADRVGTLTALLQSDS